ncbi:hypothetical protein BDR03DRAFT_971017 [Suillus americanus]|nr:hypothetical protein BDR03DRAFT_971017 [Suillus americanus]
MEQSVSVIEQFVLQYFKFAGDFSMPQHSAKLKGRHEYLGDSCGNLQRNDECWKHVCKSRWQSSQCHGIASRYNCRTIGLG